MVHIQFSFPFYQISRQRRRQEKNKNVLFLYGINFLYVVETNRSLKQEGEILLTNDVLKTRKILAHNILTLRKAKGWTQEYLAFESKTTNKCISDLELAKRNVKLDTISRISIALNVTVSEITKSK